MKQIFRLLITQSSWNDDMALAWGCYIPQGNFGCWRFPWGIQTFVLLPQSKPQQLLWVNILPGELRITPSFMAFQQRLKNILVSSGI